MQKCGKKLFVIGNKIILAITKITVNHKHSYKATSMYERNHPKPPIYSL